MKRENRPSVAVLGAGRLALSLVPKLVRAGYRVAAIHSRSERPARRLARAAPGAQALRSAAAAAREATIVLLAVPDREIAPLARDLARKAADWRGRTFLHHAGALGASLLAPLARRGAAVGVLHPLLALGGADTEFPAGGRARVEGTSGACRIASRMARDVGLVPVRLPPLARGPDRVAYHAAAAIASNDIVALLAIASELLQKAGIPPRKALPALVPLARGTVEQVAREGLARALTGPVVRADRLTLEAHLRRLARLDRKALDAHRALSARLARLARDAGRLDSASYGEILEACERARRGPRAKRGV